jgi:hypothetical protein
MDFLMTLLSSAKKYYLLVYLKRKKELTILNRGFNLYEHEL